MAKTMNLNNDKTSARQVGFTLIEILIALFVFAIGILTVAGLQIISKKSNFDAIQRTTATFLAYDIIERMRANRNQLDGYLNPLGAAQAVPGTSCKTGTCTTAQLATFDLWEWEQAINGANEQIGGNNAGGLVNPIGCIAGPAGGGDGIYTITVAWQGVTALANPNVVNVCGAGMYGANYENRRLIELIIFIAR